jgi:HEAT repeat protein
VTGGNVFNIAGNVKILSPQSIEQTAPQINWLDRSRQLIAEQKHLTTNRLLNNASRNFDDIHVSLGLIERKDRPKVKEEPSPEWGSELYRPEFIEGKRFEHEAFLAEVVANRVAGKHIAIIGEPGAGKTTILTKIGEYLIQQAEQQPESPLVVAWISLASLDKQELSEYFYTTWLKSTDPVRRRLPPNNGEEEELIKLVEQRRIWLLLDGLDEISQTNVPSWLKGQLAGWGQNLRVVMTCRSNQWEASEGGHDLSNSFEVYRTLDYSYQTSQGEDQVEKFISNWFGDNDKEVAHQIRRELDAPGKERIKDLVKNPLRLTLLCASWEQDKQALPETQAELYRGFVDYLYSWKVKEFDKDVELRDELDLALGILAKAGLNRGSNHDGAVRRFRFTDKEIRQLWKEHALPDTLLPAADKLGWLNVVEKDPISPMYAFYHPTFQEYFAACSIPDWDYFLPEKHEDRPIPCQDESVPTYRVFEQEWRQVILLWMGRKNEDIADKHKEEFIYKLTEFRRKQQGEFYYYRAYCMAAICVGEFRSSQRVDDIVEQIVTWAFGYFDTEEQRWITYLDPISSLARETILFTHRGCAIAALIDLFGDSTLANWRYICLGEALGKIAVGDERAIASLISLLKHDNLPIHHHLHVSEVLGQIAVRNESAISDLMGLLEHNITLVEMLLKEIDYISIEDYFAKLDKRNKASHLLHSIILNITDVLGEIGVANKQAIKVLTEILIRYNISDWQFPYIAIALGSIDIGNERSILALMNLLSQDNHNENISNSIKKALTKSAVRHCRTIDDLVDLMQNKDLSNSLRYKVAGILGKIGVGNENAILSLLELLKRGDLDRDRYSKMAYAIGKIGKSNEQAILAIAQLLDRNDLSDFSYDLVNVLGKIGGGNKQAILALTQLLKQNDLLDSFRQYIAVALGTIDVGNEQAISVLLELFKQDTLDGTQYHHIVGDLMKVGVRNKKVILTLEQLLKHDDLRRPHIVFNLGKIDMGNQQAISALIQLFWDKLNDSYGSHITDTIASVITKIAMPDIVEKFKNCLTDDVYEDNPRQYQAGFNLIFHCAQMLSYPSFYFAWHEH